MSEPKAAEFEKHAAPPCTNRTGNNRKRAERRQRTAFEVLRDDIFQRLPARDHVDAIADLGVAGDRADFGIREPAHKPRDRVAIELRVGIERDDDFARAPW